MCPWEPGKEVRGGGTQWNGGSPMSTYCCAPTLAPLLNEGRLLWLLSQEIPCQYQSKLLHDCHTESITKD